MSGWERLRLRFSRKLVAEKLYWMTIAILVFLYLDKHAEYRTALETVAIVPDLRYESVAHLTAFEVPERQVVLFAERFLSLYDGYVPETVEAQLIHCRELMTAGMLRRDPTALVDIRDYSRSGDVSSLIQIVPGKTEMTEDEFGRHVRIQYIKKEYTGDRLARVLLKECVVTVVDGVVGIDAKRYGLLVDRFEHRTITTTEEGAVR